MSEYRVENIEIIRLNGKNVKSFKAFKDNGDAYIYCGTFYAPAKTANKRLTDFIE